MEGLAGLIVLLAMPCEVMLKHRFGDVYMGSFNRAIITNIWFFLILLYFLPQPYGGKDFIFYILDLPEVWENLRSIRSFEAFRPYIPASIPFLWIVLYTYHFWSGKNREAKGEEIHDWDKGTSTFTFFGLFRYMDEKDPTPTNYNAIIGDPLIGVALGFLVKFLGGVLLIPELNSMAWFIWISTASYFLLQSYYSSQKYRKYRAYINRVLEQKEQEEMVNKRESRNMEKDSNQQSVSTAKAKIVKPRK